MNTRNNCGRVLVGAALLALMTACGPSADDSLTEARSIVGPLNLDGRTAYVDRQNGHLFVLDPTREEEKARLDVAKYSAGQRPGAVATSADKTKIYIVDEEGDQLLIVNAEDGQTQSVELKADYDRIAVDPEGEFVVLSFSGADATNVVARNLNEVGVVDLRGAEPEAYFVTLSTRANSFVFAPPFSLDGQPQRMMAVLANNEVTLFDLLADNEDDRLREVPLTVSEADQVRRPRKAIFDSSDPSKVDLYVLTEGADISRMTARLAASGPRKLLVSTDKLTVPVPNDFALVQYNDATRLVSISATRPEFTLVDTVSDVSVTFDLPIIGPATRLIPYVTTVTEDEETREELRILAHNTQSTLLAVIRPETVALDGDEPTLGRSVEAVRLDQVPERIEVSSGVPDQAIVFHQSSGFSLLDLRRNNGIPIQGGAIRDVLFDGVFAYVIYRTLPNLTIFADDGHPNNFDLPANGTNVFFDASEEVLLVEHSDLHGTFTVLNANEPTAENATVYESIFLQNIFGGL